PARRRGGGQAETEPGLRPCPGPAARPLPAPGRCPRAGRARWAPGSSPCSCPAGRSVLPAGTCTSLEEPISERLCHLIQTARRASSREQR
ncbi:unnamed protein product, partial [Coccothraustes coccothraustes]